MSASTFRVRTVPLALSVDVGTSVKVTNLGPDTVTYRAARDGSNLGTIAAGSSATFVGTRWFFAAGNANLRSEVVDVESDSVIDPSTGKLAEARVPESVAIRADVAGRPKVRPPTFTTYGDHVARPDSPAIVAIGDSITDVNQTATAWTGASYSRTSAYRSDGYLSRAMVLLRQRCSWFDVGISGETTAAMLARFDTDVTPLAPGIVIEAGGTNDARIGLSAATIIANRLAMWEKAHLFDAKVIATTIPPALDASTADSNVAQEVNAWMREYARANTQHFALIDWWIDLADPLTGGINAAVMDVPGIHPNSLGTLNTAAKFIAAIERFHPPTFDRLPNADVTDLANLMSRPLMTGTTGGFNGTASGVAATGNFVNGGASGAVASLVARAGGIGGNWQQLVCAGDGAVSIIKTARAEWAAGDILQAAAEFETDASGWVDGEVAALLICFAAGGVTALHYAAGLTTGGDTVVRGRMESGVLLTPPIVVPATTNSVQLHLRKLNAGTIRFGRHEVRKLVKS